MTREAVFSFSTISLFMIHANILLIPISGSPDGHVPHECLRECHSNAAPKTCEYNFTLEWYLTLSKACWDCPFNESHCSLPHCVAADGKMKAFITINRQLPGPKIEVCEGDTVVVNLYNHIEDGEAMTMHWHGLHMRGTPHMDGTSMVTQCPIPLMSGFRYEFKADPPGTHWYHAHSGVMREDGVYGPLVIRQSSDHDPHRQIYDHDLSEHTMMVNDWYPVPATTRFMFLMHDKFDIELPLSALLNGKNMRYNVTDKRKGSKQTPPEVFEVEKGMRYRFRLISSAGLSCYFRFNFDNHKITVIAGDGQPFKPVVADQLSISPGERYDFIINADQAIGNYWITGYGLGDCEFESANVVAVLRYKGAPQDLPAYEPTFPRSPNLTVFQPQPSFDVVFENDISLDQVEGLGNEDFTDETVDVRHTLVFDFLRNDNTRFNNEKHYHVLEIPAAKMHFTPVIDNITFLIPSVPLLTQWKDIPASALCNKSSVAKTGVDCTKQLCRCPHVIDLEKDKVVELIMVNAGTTLKNGHPMHLHGYSFRVMAAGKLGAWTSAEMVEKLIKEGKIKYRLKNPTYRDTIEVPDGGYVIVRLVTDNPGFWLFHCHVEGHVEQGQGLVFKVGDVEDMADTPKNFPKCGSWGVEGEPEFCPAPKTPAPKPCVTNRSSNFSVGLGLLLLMLILSFTHC